ncbi:MAG: amidohydrolase family protein [Chloroflexi bacterium]|nr:amidohydrolase family protein [Chloroflexota bacterium]
MDLTIHNALHDRNLELINLGITDGKITRITSDDLKPGTRSIDAKGSMVSPALIEPHFHLENSIMPEYPNQSGTLGEAIKIAEEIKDKLTPEDIMRRSTIALREAILNGTLWMRDHTDVDEVAKLDLLLAVIEVREKFKDVIDLQIVAFPQFGLADNPESVDLVWHAMECGADLVGGVPHHEKDMDKAARQIEIAFEIAQANDADIDMHVDETDDPYWHTLELLADKTIETGYQGRVTAGHCCAMAAWDEKLFQRILQKLVKAQVNICTNTPVNLIIQGRNNGNPARRGIARVKDLLEAGVNVTCGQDDLQNMFYPFGNMDMLSVANFVAHTAHMSSVSEIEQAFDLPRYNAAKVLRLKNYGLGLGDDATLVIFPANSPVDALRRYQPRNYVIRKGEVLVERESKLTFSPKLPFN